MTQIPHTDENTSAITAVAVRKGDGTADPIPVSGSVTIPTPVDVNIVSPDPVPVDIVAESGGAIHTIVDGIATVTVADPVEVYDIQATSTTQDGYICTGNADNPLLPADATRVSAVITNENPFGLYISIGGSAANPFNFTYHLRSYGTIVVDGSLAPLEIRCYPDHGGGTTIYAATGNV